MSKILVVDSSTRDAERFSDLLSKQGFEIEVLTSGQDAYVAIASSPDAFAAALILWEISGPPFGFDLLAYCRRRWPSMPVVVVSGTLDAVLATRAFALGAADFLEKPLDSERLKSCLENLLSARDPLSAVVSQLRERILGESPALLATLRQIAEIIPHPDLHVLLIGESGTGKELLARAIHELGSGSTNPWIAVNVGAIPPTLIESQLFGHEKGAFTDAKSRHVGFFDAAAEGTLFLDEIGDLELSLQVKFLRVIQEKEFRRLGGTASLPFRARLVCATNTDLAAAVNRGRFRRDLFHRIAEATVLVPPLRERNGDVDLLLNHFIEARGNARPVGFARETLTILRSYPFPGNIRELENLVKRAVAVCGGGTVLPQHLDLRNMGIFLTHEGDPVSTSQKGLQPDSLLSEVIEEVARSLAGNWTELPYRVQRERLAQVYMRAFDRVYLQRKLEQWRHNVTRAAADAGIDTKTFRKRCKECGLPGFESGEEGSDA